jgi:hypothetical protein
VVAPRRAEALLDLDPEVCVCGQEAALSVAGVPVTWPTLLDDRETIDDKLARLSSIKEYAAEGRLPAETLLIRAIAVQITRRRRALGWMSARAVFFSPDLTFCPQR